MPRFGMSTMPRDNKKGPWEQQTRNDRSGFPLGIFLWIGLLLVVGVVIWVLVVLFPGQVSSHENSNFQIIKLVALLALVASGLIFVRRIKLGEVVRNLSIWTGIVAVLVIGYTYRIELIEVFNRVGGEFIPGYAITTEQNSLVITASADGHYYVYGKANGKRIRFMIDTGASNITLSPEDASRIGINLATLKFTQRYQTANGIGLGAPYQLKKLTIGSLDFTDIGISVNKSALGFSLLGMSFLERLQSFEFSDGKLFLNR